MTKVNTYGIVLRWKGSDASLRPVLVTAHQGEGTLQSIFVRSAEGFADVVPVEPATVHEWIHPPYSGYFDGQSFSTSSAEARSP